MVFGSLATNAELCIMNVQHFFAVTPQPFKHEDDIKKKKKVLVLALVA